MIKNTLSLVMAFVFIAIFISVYLFFSDAKVHKQNDIDQFAKLTKSLFITQLAAPDLSELCDCDITVITHHPLSFTLRTTSSKHIESTSHRAQLNAYSEAQSGSSLKICGLVQAERDVSRSRSLVTTTVYSGLPFTSTQCDSLWAEGRGFFKPEAI